MKFSFIALLFIFNQYQINKENKIFKLKDEN